MSQLRRQNPPATSAIYHDGVLAAHAFRLADQRRDTEINLVGALLADPARGANAARAAGVRLELFQWDDTRIIAGSLRTAAQEKLLRGDDRDKRRVETIALHRLVDAHLWDPTEIAANWKSLLWSCEKLVWLFHTWFFSIPTIEHYAGKLAAVDRRQREIEETYVRLSNLLHGDNMVRQTEMAVAA